LIDGYFILSTTIIVMDKETTDAVLKLIDERRAIRKKKKKKKKTKAKKTTVAKTTTISIPMNVSGNDSRMRTVVFNRDRTLSTREQLKDDPETLKTKASGKTLKNRRALPDPVKELTSRANKGSLSLIYALQKEVSDLSKKITQPVQQSTIPYSQRGTDRFDIQSGIQRAVEEEKRKLQISAKPLTKAQMAKFESDIVDLDDGLGNIRKVQQTKSTIKPKKKAFVIPPFTQPQGIREVALDMMNPPDIGAGGGMDTLPIPEDYLNTPTWRSTIDAFERPKLREVLAEPPQEGIPYYADETIAEMPLEGEMDGGTIAELPDEGQDSQDFGDGGGDDMADDEPAQSPPPRRRVVVSGEPLVISDKKKGGRPKGSKNKPKPETDPNKIAVIGSSALKGGGGARGKTPANSPMI
jgi:hypothetical protein